MQTFPRHGLVSDSVLNEFRQSTFVRLFAFVDVVK